MEIEMKKSELRATKDSDGEYTVTTKYGTVIAEVYAANANEAKEAAIEYWESEQEYIEDWAH